MTEYSAADRKALDYCTWCPRLCHFSCPTALGEGAEDASAWGLMTLARTVDRGELPATAETNARFFSCASCGRCQSFCRHGNDVAAAMAIARERAVAAGHLPPALQGLANALAEGRAAEVCDGARALARRRGGGRGLPESSVVFMPSCAHAGDQKGVERVAKVLALLGELLGVEVGLLWRAGGECCGGDAGRLGMRGKAEELAAGCDERAGAAVLRITDCADLAGRGGWRSLWEVLGEHGEEIARLAGPEGGGKVAVHAGCREREWAEAVKGVLSAAGLGVEALDVVDGVDECCGGDAVYSTAEPEAAQRAAVAMADGWTGVEGARVTTGVRCACHLARAGEDVRVALDVLLERCGR